MHMNHHTYLHNFIPATFNKSLFLIKQGSLNDWKTRRGSIVPEFGRNMTIRNHSKSLANALTDKN